MRIMKDIYPNLESGNVPKAGLCIRLISFIRKTIVNDTLNQNMYIGSSRTNAAHKRWTQGMEEGKSRSYNDKVQEAKHECLQYSIDVVAYDLSKRDARVLEYTLINHNKNNLNIRTRPDCEFKIIKE